MSDQAFMDEKIIEMMNQVKQDAKQNAEEDGLSEIKSDEETIDTGLRIKGKMVRFKAQLFAEDKVRMMIPKDFVLMSQADAKKKYNADPGTKEIFTNQDGSINIVVECLEAGEVTDEAMEPLRDHVFGMMKRVNPGIKKHHSDVEIISDKTVAYVEFTNLAMDGKLYNFLHFSEVDGKVLMVSFNCSTKNMKYWQKAALLMMRSVVIVEGDV
ncbi:MAG: hypothetical protein FWG67_01035 [Defluviitaleaceae bacterium]|nr:hypothetical protein [Defluviitaleaceae bacterium]